MLEDLAGDPFLEKFRSEYEKVHRALKKSHEGEKRLVKKCRELNAELVANAAKVQTALKLSEEDQSTIAAHKKEIEKAWKMVDASHDKEARAKETIQQLKLETSNLSKLVEQGAGMNLGLGVGSESTLNDLLKEKEGLVRERDDQVNQIVVLRNEVMEVQEKLRVAETERLNLEVEVGSLRDSVESKRAEGVREQRKMDRLEKELKELKAALEAKQKDAQQKETIVKQGESHVVTLEQLLRESRTNTDKVTREFNQVSEKLVRLQRDLEESNHVNLGLQAENAQKLGEIKLKEDEISSIRQETTKVGKLREAALNRLRTVEKQKTDVETTRDGLKLEINNLEKDVELSRKGAEVERKKQDELIRERDILNKLKTQAENATQRQTDLVKINENTKKNLEQELQGYRGEAQKQNKLIWQLEKERDKYGADSGEATSKYLQALEEVKLREMAIVDLQKTIAEGENKLKQQQNLYEAVRSDRNLYSKNLIEAQDEIQEMKRKFKILNHQIEQLKEEIGAKDLALVKEHSDFVKVEKEKESLRLDLNKARQQIMEAEGTIASQKAETVKLNHIINEADAERLRQKKEYDMVINERDILGTQLIRRNDELALLYEKIKIQQSTLAKGQTQYRDRVKEARLVKIKLNDLKRELHILKNSVANIDVLKREVHHLGRELLQERTKVKALSEELENPLNVHRWRKLEGSDPTTYEMIQKVQTLQKRLIAKTEEVVEKDTLIQEKEKLYVELKNILARQPGPEVAEQLSVYQQGLREKTRQMKAMASELNMYQAQVNEYRYEIERLTRELQDMKRRYYEQKMRETREAREAGGDKGTFKAADKLNPYQSRFMGGGFSLSQ